MGKHKRRMKRKRGFKIVKPPRKPGSGRPISHCKEAKSMVNEEIREILKKEKIKITMEDYKIRPLKYSRKNKKHLATLVEGYDLLEHMLAVRRYVQEKYKCGFEMLEICLALYPKNLFTREDLNSLPKEFTMRNKRLVSSKFLTSVSKNPKKMTSIFRLSNLGRNMVEEFYQMLTGEKGATKMWIAKNSAPGRSRFIKNKARILDQLKEMPVKETKKVFVEE